MNVYSIITVSLRVPPGGLFLWSAVEIRLGEIGGGGGKRRRKKLEPVADSQSVKPAVNNGHQIRFRSPSSAELEAQSQSPPLDKMKRGRQESLSDKIHRHRSLIIVLSVPLILVSFVLFLMPRVPSDSAASDLVRSRRAANNHVRFLPDKSTKNYVVIFDAGSSGSRVHVFCFDHNLDLLPIGKDVELFLQKKPGLSYYANDPLGAANSLNSLLLDAENAIPSSLHVTTPVKVGATAGLRALEGDASDRILEAVRDFLHKKSSFKFESDWVTVLDGTQEGAYQWVTINYLLGNLGKGYSRTVGVVDLGGGSVQMAYAISEDDAAKAPAATNGEDSYVKELFLKGTKYFLYVHSYLHYGLLAARAEILKAGDVSGNPCIMKGYHGTYKYSGSEYPVSASHSGSSVNTCKSIALKALKVNDSACTHMKCTFGGIWNGGGGDGQKNLFVASFFFDRAAEAGFVDPFQPVVKVKPSEFEDAAKRACESNLDDARKTYPRVEEGNLPYLCMDLVYQYTLLVDGFALDPWQEITLVKKIKYGDHHVEAAWPLGSAIEAVSSL